MEFQGGGGLGGWLWDRLRCGGTYGVCAREFSRDDGRKLCPLSKKKRTNISQRRSTQCHAETADDDTMARSDMALKYLLTISAILYHGHGTGWVFFEISLSFFSCLYDD